MFGESITILRPGVETGAYDEQGNPVIGPDEEITSEGWAAAPATSAETAEPFAQQVIVGYVLYKRDSVEDVRETDRVLLRGEVWAVAGQVGEWVSPYTGFEGTVVNVKAVG